MLTPKCRPRDFCLRARPNSPKKRLYRLKPNQRGRNQAGIREEFGGLTRAREYCYINDLDWLGRQDSNLGSRDQSPLPYRLATPQSACDDCSAREPPAQSFEGARVLGSRSDRFRVLHRG